MSQRDIEKQVKEIYDYRLAYKVPTQKAAKDTLTELEK
jgi:hypothetical protein